MLIDIVYANSEIVAQITKIIYAMLQFIVSLWLVVILLVLKRLGDKANIL